MTQKFLLGCFQVPVWGGASTFIYTLFERMRRDGYDVEFVNAIEDQEEPFLRRTFGAEIGNPSALDGVHNVVVRAPLWRAQPDLAAVIRDVRPDLVVVCGFIAARLMKLAAPEVPLAFITSGSWNVKRLLKEGAIDDFMDFERRIARGIVYPVKPTDQERRAVEESDLVILHSPMVRVAFEHFFPDRMGKVYAKMISIADCVYDEAERFVQLARPFAERDIDVIFISCNWARPEKNYPAVRRIAEECRDLRVHVVGRSDGDGGSFRGHGVVTHREDLYALLGRARVIVCPSHLDPAPGVLFEASAMGCNVVASPNSGNWELCAPQLLAHSPGDFTGRIRRALAAPVPDGRARFRGGYRDLIETLRAFL